MYKSILIAALRHWGYKCQRKVFDEKIKEKMFSGDMVRQNFFYDIQNYVKINFVHFVRILSNFQQMLKKMPKFEFFQVGPMVL